MTHQRYSVFFLMIAAMLGACAPGARIENAPEPIEALPPIPERTGSVDIDLVYPREGALKPDADSTFLFGSVGSGDADLTINSHSVAVAPNGAFLAYVPVPRDGTYTFAASSSRDADQLVYTYATPTPRAPAVESFDEPRRAVVEGGRDTLATGSQVVHAYPAPGADRRWFFPPGTELTATGRAGSLVRIRLTSRTDAWLDSSSVQFAPSAPEAARADTSAEAALPASDETPPDNSAESDSTSGDPQPAAAPDDASEAAEPQPDASVEPDADTDTATPAESQPSPSSATDVDNAVRYVDVTIDAGRAPFLIIPQRRNLGVVIYGREAPSHVPPLTGFIESAAWRNSTTDSAYLHLDLKEPLWGYKAFFDDDGALVVRLRRPPDIAPSEPVRGLRIMVDPGHPPGGAIGPTGYTEAEANLAIGLNLADMLRERGAEVVMTRTSAAALVNDSLVAPELWARVDLAVNEDMDLLVSIHNNAFADGVNPFENYGTETYYYHSFSEPLADALRQRLVSVTGLPDLGAKQRSLALVRPSWMPSTLTESLFMMFPQQEAALRNPSFQERLARAHLEGILDFLREVQR